MKWPPESALPRLDAIRKARSWWTGVDLHLHSGEHFWTDADATAKEKWTEATMRRKHRVHVPVAGDLSLVSADHLFGGGIELPDDPEIQELAEQVGLTALLPQGAERASGMGEVYLRLGWRDGSVPLLSVIDADRVIPTFSWGRMIRATVWADLEKHDNARWVHLEHHEPGVIRHELRLRSGDTSVDDLTQSLGNHPDTANLEPEVPLPDAIADRLALLYVANSRPKVPRPGGASDTEGSEALMASVDETISSLQRDIRLGKSRIVVPDWMLTRHAELGTAYFDTTAEVFAPIGSMADKETTAQAIEVVQFELRVTQHLDAARDYVRQIVSSAGFAPESMIRDRSQLPESGTSRRLREAASIRTTQRKIMVWRPVIAEALSSLAVIANPGRGEAPDVSVSIRSTHAPDVAETANLLAQLEAAGAASTLTKVKMLHPTWSEDEQAAEVVRINTERPAERPSPPGPPTP